MKSLSRRILLVFMAILMPALLIAQPTVSAITEEALKSILNNTPFYGEDAGFAQCNDSINEAGLSGSDNIQKGFNYFVGKGLTDNQSAGIIGNFMQESGMNPKADQAGGPGMGLAQWSNPGRWTQLLEFAKLSSVDPLDLLTQLDFTWAELEGTPPASKQGDSLELLKATTTVEDATTVFEEHFERAGTPMMENRIEFAKQVLGKYGSGGTGDGATAVSGSTASCGSTGAVDCSNFTTSTSTLSQVRQNVVCLTEAEFVKWEKGEMGRGTDFYTYSQGRNEEWCADFVSWIYNEAGYPLKEGNEGNVAAVQAIREIGEAGGKFKYHDAAGYTPVPGDIVVYQEDWSHVNIVVSVNTNDSTMVVIGGNESGTSSANTTSIVNKSTHNSFSGGQITGYVSPEGN